MNIDIIPSCYKILVVDDNEFNVQLLVIMLGKNKYNVVTASCGKEALEKVEKEKPDLILLDIMMPDMSGYEVAQRLKGSKEYNDIPILFLSALSSVEDIVKGFKMGADDYITKPFNKEELVTRITHQLALISAKRMIIKSNEELRQLILERDKFYSLIAHDMRSPLGILKMSLNILSELKKEQIGDMMYDIISMSNKTAEEMFIMLDNLLKWARCRMGRIIPVFQKYNISDLIQSITEQIKTIANLRNISIIAKTPKEIIAEIDIDMVKTIVRNLVNNAIKFSKCGDLIEIIVEDGKDFVTIHIKDQGCGIKEEDKHKILNFNFNHTTYGMNNEEGSGLGLLLCSEFTEKNNGKIWFESEEGVGSTFSFTLPKKQTNSIGWYDTPTNQPQV